MTPEPDYHRILLIFVDGVGLAPAAGGNPLAAGHTPTLDALLGGPLTRERVGLERPGLVLRALDAGLGVPGLPQSATGQTALFTGVNGARLLGRHLSAFPGPRLRRVIEESSLFLQAGRRGWETAFANAYSAAYLEKIERGGSRRSVTTCAAIAADLALRRVEHLERGEAVTWDITRDHFASFAGEPVSGVEPRLAGRHLAGLAARHRLTVFETFITDLAGHRRFGITAGEALRRLDGLLAGVLAELASEVTLLVTSDHGNLEDAEARTHTRNPVPLLARGPLAARFAPLGSILEVTPAILEALASPPS